MAAGGKSRALRQKQRRKTPKGVAKKTQHLIAEGYDPKQAYGAAWGMYRAGRLTKEGKYIRKRRKK